MMACSSTSLAVLKAFMQACHSQRNGACGFGFGTGVGTIGTWVAKGVAVVAVGVALDEGAPGTVDAGEAVAGWRLMSTWAWFPGVCCGAWVGA